MRKIFLSLLLMILLTDLQAQNDLPTEIIYGRKDGTALTMLQLKPTAKANGKAIIMVIAGAWFSSYRQATATIDNSKKLYVEKGYTVFDVIVGSQPRFAIPDQISDVKRAVRYIRYNAEKLGIDPNHIGISGYSAGGHLSLAVAMADENIDKGAADPVDRVSSRVQAVAVLFPPTNFLDWGGTGFNLVNQFDLQLKSRVYGAFNFMKWIDSTRNYEPVSDTAARNKIGRDISPIYSVSPDDPPVFIMHGDADSLVPLQQSESIIAKLKQAGVQTKFIIKKGVKHDVDPMQPELMQFADWFDMYLK
jgi:acetyl esterase/lipase